MKLRFRLWTLRLLPAVLSTLLTAFWWWPKSQPLSLNTFIYVGYYRGLGITSDSSFFGKRFYYIKADDGENGYWEVDFQSVGYNAYRGYYPDGILREEGECFVEWNGDNVGNPAPDNNNVRWGKYYKPDGSLDSEVIDGTGIQNYWTPNGKEIWELKLKDFVRQQVSIWYQNGQLSLAQQYKGGVVHGKFTGFHQDGSVRVEGEYAEGQRTGIWTRYEQNGSVKSEEDYSISSPSIASP